MTKDQAKRLHDAYEANDTAAAFAIFEEIPKEELEEHVEINPATGKKDGIYTVFLAALAHSNIKSMAKKRNITEEAFVNEILNSMQGFGYPVPKEYLS